MAHENDELRQQAKRDEEDSEQAVQHYGAEAVVGEVQLSAPSGGWLLHFVLTTDRQSVRAFRKQTYGPADLGINVHIDMYQYHQNVSA